VAANTMHVISAGFGLAGAEVSDVGAAELLRHGRRPGHHDVEAAEAQAQQRAVHQPSTSRATSGGAWLLVATVQLRQVAQ